MPLKIIRNDITKMQVDAIVNTANEDPCIGAGVDSAVYRAAGEEQLLSARAGIGRLAEGDAAVTPGFDLPARYIIHAVSPYYYDGENGEEAKLRSCYRKSLELARQLQCKSMAFPLIATGGYGYPKEEGMRIAVDEIHAFLLRHDMLIYLVVFDEHAVRLGRQIYPDLKAYIDRNYVSEKRLEEYGGEWYTFETKAEPAPPPAANRPASRKRREETAPKASKNVTFPAPPEEAFYERTQSALQRRMEHMSDTFQEYLLYMIEEKGLKNAEVYKRAILTKQLFSKIRTNPNYHPDKATAMRLCIGAGLNLDETKDLLARAGYALSPCDKRDIIFSYFIENHIYDMIEIDIALEEYGLPCFID